MAVNTLEDAWEFVQRVGLCGIFPSKGSSLPTLWEAASDLPERTGGKTKWGARLEAVWAWKNELPETYPDEVFYGKIKGGNAVLMSLRYLRETHYPQHHRAISTCSALAQQLHEIIRLDPAETAEVRAIAMERTGCTKSRFDTALKELQVTLNITRANDPGTARDRWLPFHEQYPDIGRE